MHVVKGQLTKMEYYSMYFRSYRFYFLLVAITAFIPALYGADLRQLLDIQVLIEYLDVILFNWSIFFSAGLLAAIFVVFIIAFIRKGTQLEPREYLFSEEHITVRSEIGEVRLPWEKSCKLKERKSKSYLILPTSQKVYLFDRFFESRQHKEDVLSFIKKKLGEVQ